MPVFSLFSISFLIYLSKSIRNINNYTQTKRNETTSYIEPSYYVRYIFTCTLHLPTPLFVSTVFTSILACCLFAVPTSV